MEIAASAHAVGQVFARTLHKTWRRPVLLTFSLVQPLWWMLLFGFLFQRAMGKESLAGVDYLSFVAPGVSLMAVLFGASQAGISIVRDAQTGMLARMLEGPSSSALLLLGKLLADVLRLLAMSLCVLALGLLLGAQPRLALHALPLAALSVFGFGFLFASISCAFAALTREPELMGAYVHVINMPLLFTSSALVPQRLLPEWLAWLAQANPMSLAVTSVRAAFLGSEGPRGISVLALCAGALVAFVVASWSLARRRVQS